MNQHEHASWCFQSPFLALAWEYDSPALSYLSVESGGRLRRHLDHNLLVPGRGGFVEGIGTGPHAQPQPRQHGLFWPKLAMQHGGHVSLETGAPDERTLEVIIRPGSDHTEPVAFTMVLDPAIASPTIWSATTQMPAYPPPVQSSESFPPDLVNRYGLPMVLHAPDFGMLRIEGSATTCHECWRANPDRFGLSLGLHNRGGHRVMHAFHRRQVVLRWQVDRAGQPLHLRMTVGAEIHPPVPDDPAWDGLKRCWHNAFTLHRTTMTMGDNPLLNGVAHLAIHFKSEMALYTPAVLDGLSLQDVLARALDLGFTHCQGPTGEINWCHLEQPDRCAPGPFIDTTPSNLLALHDHLAATGNWPLLHRHRQRVLRAVDFLLNLQASDGSGMLELPYHGNDFDGSDGQRTRNWWDNIAFGHRDACFMLLCHRALHGMQRVFEAADMAKPARRIAAWRRRFARNFHRVFWVPATRRYAGWVSLDGRQHDHAYTFVTAMAINENLVTPARGRAMMRRLLTLMCHQGYDGAYGIPGNLEPIDPADTIQWPVLGAWGRYENGGLCGMTAGHVLKALDHVGLEAEADRIFFAMLRTFENERTHSGPMPGYAQSVDWRTRHGLPCGYNYLADNYYFLIAGMRRAGHVPPAVASVV